MTPTAETITALIILAACLVLLAAHGLRALAAWSDREIDRHITAALALPDPDATDAEFEAWARDALEIANSAAFAAFEASVLADIEALTNGDIA